MTKVETMRAAERRRWSGRRRWAVAVGVVVILGTILADAALILQNAWAWVPVTRGEDSLGTKWVAYVSDASDGEGICVSIAPPGQPGSNNEYLEGCGFQKGCSIEGCNGSDPNGLYGNLQYGLVPSQAIAVVVGPGKTVPVHPLPGGHFLPAGGLFVYLNPSLSSSTFDSYPIDTNGNRLHFLTEK
jgi:H+/Cl- antiporter ClcA